MATRTLTPIAAAARRSLSALRYASPQLHTRIRVLPAYACYLPKERSPGLFPQWLRRTFPYPGMPARSRDATMSSLDRAPKPFGNVLSLDRTVGRNSKDIQHSRLR